MKCRDLESTHIEEKNSLSRIWTFIKANLYHKSMILYIQGGMSMRYRYLQTSRLIENKFIINDIPIITLRPDTDKYKIATIFLYHGWNSRKEGQRLSASILANLGYQVIIPDMENHGDRQKIKLNNLEKSQDYFWSAVLKGVEEFPNIKEFAIKELQADKTRLGVYGVSMGGFTAQGIFNNYDDVKVGVCALSSGSWVESSILFRNSTNYYMEMHELRDKDTIYKLDPIRNLDKLNNRALLLLNGVEDSIVPIDSQENYYDAARLYYEDANKIKLITYKALDHFVTSNMLEEMVIWFRSYL